MGAYDPFNSAKWIWSSGEASPRNEWWCFRKAFDINSDPAVKNASSASISLTADSRYELYINGQHIGRGPVRCWPFEQSYDTYEIGHLLCSGRNVVAVLVMHFGVSTFSYIRGRGGILAHIGMSDGEDINSDSSWKVQKYTCQNPFAPRISCQLGFTEIIDARLLDDNWIKAEFDDSVWDNATVIGDVGIKPWTSLIERDIPFLTEEPMWPVRVTSLKHVKPVSCQYTIDIRNHMLSESADHVNKVGYIGYIATIINTRKSGKATIGFPNATANFGPCSLNGRWFSQDDFFGVIPERYVDVELKQGENIFIMDVTGIDHGKGLHIGIDCESDIMTDVELVSPVDIDADDSPFVTIGPFEVFVTIDHQGKHPLEKYRVFSKYSTEKDIIEDFNEDSFNDFSVYHAVKSVSSLSELLSFDDWIKPVNKKLVSDQSVFTRCVWKKEFKRLPVPMSLQNLVIPSNDHAEIPILKSTNPALSDTGTAIPESDTEIIIDFGKELSGYIEFTVDASAGTILDFYGFEYMKGNYIQHTYDLQNTLRYVCRAGHQSYISTIRRGLRYLMLTVRKAKRPVNIYGVKLLQSNYPVAEIGQFNCSDSLLNEIWKISQHTTRLCMEDTFIDCPTYEQAFWVGDARNEALINYYIFGTLDIVKRCLRLVPGSEWQTPLYANQVPSGWNSVLPNWTFFWVIACYEYYLHTGDVDFTKNILPHIKSTLHAYLDKINDYGLLFTCGWNMLDWAPMDQPDVGIVTPQNMFLVRALECAADLAEIVNDKDTAALFMNKASSLNKAINEFLWCDDKNAYIDCIHEDGSKSKIVSMQTQVVASLCDIAKDERARVIDSYILDPPKCFVKIGSPFMAFFYYEALSKLGCFDKLTEHIREHYGMMVKHGATTCWETFPGNYEDQPDPEMLTRSHCHAWSSAPSYFFGKYILGIRNCGPGWDKVIIEPNVCNLNYANGCVPLPDGGQIDVAWEIGDDGRCLRLDVTAPAEIELDIRVPAMYICEEKVTRY